MERTSEADLRRLRALTRVIHAANRVSDEEQAVAALLREAATGAEADEAALFRYDLHSGRLLNDRTSASPYGGRASFGLGEGVVGQVAATGRGLVVGDAETAGAIVAPHGRAPRSLLCLPLLVEHSLIGVLSFVSYARDHAWTEDDLKVLAPYAELLSAVLNRRDLRTQLHARREEIELLTSMAAIAPRIERYSYVLGQLANVVAELVRAEACAFLLADHEGRFVVQPGFNVSGGETGLLVPSLARQLSEGEIFSGDPSASKVVPFDWMRELGTCEVMVVPFRLEQGGLSLLYIRLARGQQFDTMARSALRLAANQAAHLIDNMHLYRSLQESYIDSVASLALSIEAKDSGTKGHSEAVSQLSKSFGTIIGLDTRLIEDLRMSSLLHDIGKIGIRDSILLKEGPLSEDEWLVMRRHPELGARIVRSLPIADRLLPAVLHHHERWDGRGYPHGLTGDAIPLIARITSITDAYQVITSRRPYKEARSMADAVKEIARCAGSQFDPELAKAFCENAIRIDRARAEREGFEGFRGGYGE